MRRTPRKQVTVHLPRALARDVDDLIEGEVIPHVSRDEFVRDAVARRLEEIRTNTRAAFAPREDAADSSFAAESANAKPRLGAVDDRSPAPGIETRSAVGAEDDCVS